MATRPAAPSGSSGQKPEPEAPYRHGEPIPLPEVIDENSEASWALWREATDAPSNWEADTELMDFPKED